MTVESLTALESLNEFRLETAEREKAIAIFQFMNEQEAMLSSVNTDDLDVMVHCMPMTNVLREDVRAQAFTREELLAGAPERSEDCWVVPRLVK